MKNIIILVAILLSTYAFADWKPAGNQIKTKWGEEINVNNVLPEYPRPRLERSDWLNLNGLWDYAITRLDARFEPQGKILVPFAVESSLSGVGKVLDDKHLLWYERTFEIPQNWDGKEILLHFGAVDWKCTVWVNDIKVGGHIGGYTPFNFNITSALKKGKNTIRVRVFDPTDIVGSRIQPCGKQAIKPYSCFYTAVSGIWQTVWLEPVNKAYIKDVKITPNLDEAKFIVEVKACPNTTFEVDILEKGKLITTAKAKSSESAELSFENMKVWWPERPFLYDLQFRLIKDGKVVDTVKSYTAMRKVSILSDTKRSRNRNKNVIAINNKPIYNFGPLDQGWWPDGLYTAPSDEALAFDIIKTKQWGFNMIRKHIKVEPARWYYHADRLGILVWQDMPCGTDMETKLHWVPGHYLHEEKQGMSDKAYENWMREYKDMIDFLYSHPSVVMWIPFNENWGQAYTAKTVAWTKQYDPTRIVNAASGGNYHTNDNSDVLDIHSYPEPRMLLTECGKINVMGEYGGLRYDVANHMWNNRKIWGYQKEAFKNADELLAKYEEFVNMLIDMRKHGFVSAVYTQTTDVENEVNGIMTYDRKIVKFDEQKLRAINQKLINTVK